MVSGGVAYDVPLFEIRLEPIIRTPRSANATPTRAWISPDWPGRVLLSRSLVPTITNPFVRFRPVPACPPGVLPAV